MCGDNMSWCRSVCLSYFEIIEILGCVDSCLSSSASTFQPSLVHIFFLPLSFPSSTRIPIMCTLVCLIESHRSLKFCLVFFIIFLSGSQYQ